MRSILLFLFFILLTSNTFAKAKKADPWKGNYICTVDDKSEIFDSEYDNGHHYFDLDGDTSDPKINIPVSITEQKVLIGQLFAGKPIAPLHFKRIGFDN